jgi:nucleolar protein 56
MKAFQPFVSAEQALENQNDISEGILNDTLRGFLEQNLDKPKPGKLTKFQLGVTDVKIGQAVQDEMSIKCVSDELVLELMRYVFVLVLNVGLLCECVRVCRRAILPCHEEYPVHDTRS